MLDRAKQADSRGDTEQTESLLKQATAAMYESVRLTGKDQSLVVKESRDFDSRLESITALCDAYDRIRDEKGLGSADGSKLYPIVHSKIDQAKALKAQGRVGEGRMVLDEAYVAAKVAIESLRGGDTLVRSLNFESKEEEYHYEVDRNETHRMLISILLKEKMQDNGRVRGMVEQYMDKATLLRKEADQQAAVGRYEDAVHTLEQSTREIVKAIRSAGIFIPG